MWVWCQSNRTQRSHIIPKQPVNPALLCGISQEQLRAPMVSTCGHAVCESCLFQWLKVQSGESGETSSAHINCVICRNRPLWYYPCFALNDLASPNAKYTNSDIVVTKHRGHKILHWNAHIYIGAKTSLFESLSRWLSRWLRSCLQEWAIRITLLSIAIMFWAWTPWSHYLLIPLTATLFGSLWRQVPRSEQWLINPIYILSVLVTCVCAISHFLATVAPWMWLVVAVIGCIHSSTIVKWMN